MTDSFTIVAASDFSTDPSERLVISIIDAGGPLQLCFTRDDQKWHCHSEGDSNVLLCDDNGQHIDKHALSFPCFVSVRNHIFSLVLNGDQPFLVPEEVIEFFKSSALFPVEIKHDAPHSPTDSPKPLLAATSILSPVNALAFLGLTLALGIGVLGTLFMPQSAMTNEMETERTTPVRIVQANVSALETQQVSLMDTAQKEAAAKAWILSSLERVGLASQISAKSGPGQLHLSGELNTRQIQVFEKLLLDFERQNNDIDFSASIRHIKPAIPFKIKEISTGENGWIVTDGGVQVFIGGEYKGYRLVSLSQKRIHFTGPDSVELSL